MVFSIKCGFSVLSSIHGTLTEHQPALHCDLHSVRLRSAKIVIAGRFLSPLLLQLPLNPAAPDVISLIWDLECC